MHIKRTPPLIFYWELSMNTFVVKNVMIWLLLLMVAASKNRQFLLYLFFVLFSKPFNVFFFLQQKYIIFIIFIIFKCRNTIYLLWNVSLLKCVSFLTKFLKRHYVIEKELRIKIGTSLYTVSLFILCGTEEVRSVKLKFNEMF